MSKTKTIQYGPLSNQYVGERVTTQTDTLSEEDDNSKPR